MHCWQTAFPLSHTSHATLALKPSHPLQMKRRKLYGVKESCACLHMRLRKKM